MLSKTGVTKDVKKNIKPSEKITDQQNLKLHLEKWEKYNFTLANFSQLVEDINSKERLDHYRGTIGIAKLLSSGLVSRIDV